MNTIQLTAISSSLIQASKNTANIIYNSIRQAPNKISNIKNSIFGKLITGLIKENIVEESCYLGTALVTAPLAKRALTVVFGKTGKITGIILAVYGSKKAAEIAFSKSNLTSLNRAIFSVLCYSIISTGMLFVVPNYLEQMGEHVGGQVGAFAGYYLGGVLGGFLGMNLYGSDISLKSYLVRRLSNDVMTEIASVYLPQSLIVNCIGSQAAGSIAFHADELYLVGKEAMQGKLLTGVLPLQIQDLNGPVCQRLAGQLNALSRNIIENHPYGQMIPQISPLVSATFIKTMIPFLKGINHYFNFIDQHPEIRARRAEFDAILKKITQSETPAIFEQAFADAKGRLIEAIGRKFPQHLLTFSNGFPRGGLSPNTLASLIFLNPHLNNEIAEIAKAVVELSKDEEKKLFGFSMSNQKVERAIREFLAVHLIPLVKLTIAEFLVPSSNFSSDEARKVYQNLAQVTGDIYQPLLGSFMTRKLVEFFHYQIANA